MQGTRDEYIPVLHKNYVIPSTTDKFANTKINRAGFGHTRHTVHTKSWDSQACNTRACSNMDQNRNQRSAIVSLTTTGTFYMVHRYVDKKVE